MAELLQTLSIVFFVVAGVCLLLAAFFWFFFKIPTVIGDLSGRTAKKSIEKMRQGNVRTGKKSYRSSATNVERGKLTNTMEHTAKQAKQTTASRAKTGANPAYSQETAPLYGSEETAPLYGSEETAPLYGSEETAPLYESEETAPLYTSEETAPLYASAETEPLYASVETAPLYASAETAPLYADNGTCALDDSGETMPLNLDATPASAGKRLSMINHVMLIHTDEVI